MNVKKKKKKTTKNCNSKVTVQSVQTCLPEIKLVDRLVSLAERKHIKANIKGDTSIPLKLVR